jgi:hypothetical protein
MEKKNRPLQAANSDIRVSDVTPLKFGCYSYSISGGNALPLTHLLYDSAIPQ